MRFTLQARGYAVPKTNVIVYKLEELLCRSLQGIKANSKVAMFIVRKPIHVHSTVTAN